MNEPVNFEYVNNSLTTLPQHRLVSAIARHFRMPGKMARASLDQDMLATDQLLNFSIANPGIRDNFYLASFKINISQLLNSTKFDKSQFKNEHTIMMANPRRSDAIFVIYTAPSLFAMYDARKLSFGSVGGGGIYINHSEGFEHKLIVPFSTFLNLRYPLPSL